MNKTERFPKYSLVQFRDNHGDMIIARVENPNGHDGGVVVKPVWYAAEPAVELEQRPFPQPAKKLTLPVSILEKVNW